MASISHFPTSKKSQKVKYAVVEEENKFGFRCLRIRWNTKETEQNTNKSEGFEY